MKLVLDQNRTPLFDAMKKYAEDNVIPFHVPGHKQGAGLREFAEYYGDMLLKTDVNGMDDLGHRIDGGVTACNFDVNRIVQQATGELANLIGAGCRKQQVLSTVAAIGRQQCDYLADIADEPHVEHPVGLVEYEDFHLGKIESFLADVIEQTSGSGYNDVHTAAQF